MILFFDTETTGLPQNWNAPASDTNNWPRLVQIAWLTYSNTGELLSKEDHILKPEGFTIPESATAIHGISQMHAFSYGHNVDYVLQSFTRELDSADIIVGHNLSYDEKVVSAEFIRLGYPNPFQNKRKICTMKSSTNHCRLGVVGDYKFPTLIELYFKLFKTQLIQDHDALTDVTITSSCFWELIRLKIINLQSNAQSSNFNMRITSSTNSQPTNTALAKQAIFLKGFLESLSYSDSISAGQIDALRNRLDVLIKTIEENEEEEEEEEYEEYTPPVQQPSPPPHLRPLAPPREDDLPF